MEGWLVKRGEKGPIKNWKRRYFREVEKRLVYFRSDVAQASMGTIELDQVISVHPCNDFRERALAFQINTESRVFYLEADTENLFHYWVTGLVMIIKEAGTADKLVIKQVEEKEARKREQQEKASQSKNTRTGLKLSRTSKPKAMPTDIPPASPQFRLPQISLSPERVSEFPKGSEIRNSICIKPEIEDRRDMVAAKSEPSKNLNPAITTSKRLSDTRENINSDDSDDFDMAIEEFLQVDKKFIGHDVLGVDTPSRAPPRPPSTEEEQPIIRVTGTVVSTTEKEKKTSNVWVTRQKDPKTQRVTILMTTRSTMSLLSDTKSHRTKLILEVILTEETYVESLQLLVHHYFTPLKSDKRIQREVMKIFGNVEQILQLNEDLLQQLQSRIHNWSEKQSIGDIFKQMAPFFKLYSVYGTNYEAATQVYTKEMKENSYFRGTVETKNFEAGESTFLHHLLITPIQRIPRYNMLLADIIKHTEPSHPDYQNLVDSLRTTQEVALHLNESVRASEMERNMMDLAERMDIEFLFAPHRRLIREGGYRVIVGKKEKHNIHHLILFNDILVCISHSKIRKPSEFTNPTNQYPLSLVWFEEQANPKSVKNEKSTERFLRVTVPGQLFLICFDNSEDIEGWKHVLHEALATSLKDQPKSTEEIPGRPADALPQHRFGSFTYSNGFVYEGWFLKGLKQGKGRLRFYYNAYDGNFDNDVMSGHGKIIYPSGEVYTGQWEMGLPHGRGTFGAPCGDVYDGEWKGGRKEGKGKYVYCNGDIYEGEWADDLPHGHGKCNYSSGKRYDGEWDRGQRSGVGSFDKGNGGNYEGNWLEDNMHGHGTLVEIDGSYFEGDFVNGSFEGNGVMVFKDGRKYSGEWKGGKPCGVGTYNSAIGQISQVEGDWVNGSVHGKAVIQFSSGERYSGNVHRNRFHGNGSYEFGAMIIEGKWNNGILEGKVTVQIGQDQVMHGIYRHNSIYLNEGNDIPLLLPCLISYVAVEI